MDAELRFSYRQSSVGFSPERLEFDGNVTVLRQLDIEQDVLCICYTETYEFLAAGLTDGTVKLYKTNSKGENFQLRDIEITQKPSPVTSIKHRPVHRSHPITRTIIATYVNGCVKCWHYPSSQCLYTIREKRQTLGLAYHNHLPKFVTVGNDAKIFLYDEETKKLERAFQASESLEVMDGHKSRVFCACFNPKSAHELISGGWDDTIQFWDTRQPHALRRISGVHICGDALDISKNGREILSCAWQRDNSIQLWDYGSGKHLVTVEPDSYSSLLYCGKYVTNMFLACGGSDTNLFRVVDLRSHATLAMVRNLTGGTYSFDIGPVNPKYAKKTRTVFVVPQLAFCAGRHIFEIDAQPG
nr:PREDICTED: WD repeat-containing protein 5B-like [Megachile rotundata]XP_012139035.1 PREDICTED: WD repeat-containing protein 5B-like [Megachile rotundata]